MLSSQSDDVIYEDHVETIKDGLFLWKRTFTATKDYRANYRLTMDFAAHYEMQYFMIPSVSYNGNPWGNGDEPRGLALKGEPWTFAWHRTAIAGATYTEGHSWSVALFGSTDDHHQRFSCSLEREEDRVVHRLIWPEEEGPLVYHDRDSYDKALLTELFLKPGEQRTMTAYLVVAPVEQPKIAWHKMLEEAWTLNRKLTRPKFDPERIWKLSLTFAQQSLWAYEESFEGCCIGLMHNGVGWEQIRHYEIGWCGQNASYANSFLFDYLKSGDEESLRKGLAVLDSWTGHARMKNGLIHCHYDYVLFKSSENEVQDACNLGTAAMNFMEAENLASKCGVDRPEYLETALGICDFAVRKQAVNGQIGKSWTNDGVMIDPNGTVGCFLIPPLVMAYRLTKQRKYLEAAEKGYHYYVSELAEKGYTTGGALDTYCIDKESAIPLLKAGLLLYETTGNSQYLEWAELAAWYLASWQWHHTVHYPENSELARIGYDTFGGTAVSTQHHHLDPYALAFVENWIRLSDITGKLIWRERALAVWSNATQGISDGKLIIMGKERPVGSQDEGFYHTRWKNTFHVSEWLVAWPSAFRLEVLRRTEDWSIFK
ncbi:hypothetical protein [Paenibacillus luteus]|uniref:hypothetical protein n=1 Tax=Paenibacillus luteus TaxID=2545753 RepID=UPI0019D57306|nr:hypothetical protein [Paenibacillus luteus]